MSLDPESVRARFPSLHTGAGEKPRIYFDNPGGTQVADLVIDRTVRYFRENNANTHGTFETSRRSDALLQEAHESMAAFLNAPSWREIIFGQNMTSLTFSISRSIGRTLREGDEIILTRMDHDGNVSPWLMLAEDCGARVVWLDFDPETSRYRMDMLPDLLSPRTRIVCVNHASNAIGTINDVAAIGRMAHEAGALVYVDSVQYAPHAPIDVQALGCDFLVCSAYKFFGPHQGILWGRRELLESLTPYKVRPADDELPVRFETGTLSHEGIAGTLGAIEYLEWVGKTMGIGTETASAGTTGEAGGQADRTKTLHSGMRAIAVYEHALTLRLIRGVESIPGLRIYGLTGEDEMADRVPTVSFTSARHSPLALSEALGEHGIFTWEGDYYAMEVIARLGLAASGGMLRTGLAHYNTAGEVDTFLNVLEQIQKH